MYHHPPYFYGGIMPVMMLPPPPPPPVVFAGGSNGVEVHPVWAHNLDHELALMRAVVSDAVFAAVHVHHPGVIHGAGQVNASLLTAEQRYAAIKSNVDELKPLQLGLAFHTARGHRVAFEFNLRDFNASAGDRSTRRSLSYLERRGLVLADLRLHGVPAVALAPALALVCGRRLRWATYSGAYHAAYLVKVINGGRAAPLPDTVVGFIAEVRRLLGPDVFDVARMAADFHGGPVELEMIAGRLGIPPPLWSPTLAGAGAARAMEVFVALMHRLGGDVSAYSGFLQGLQVT